MQLFIEAVRSGVTLREVEKMFRLSRSTVHRHMQRMLNAEAGMRSDKQKAGRRRAFTESEESIVVEMLCRYSDRGVPLGRKQVAEAFAILVVNFSAERRYTLPFRDRRPGKTFLQSFTLRHRATLRFAKPLMQEGKRYASVNTEALTQHFAVLARIYEDYNLDVTRVWNIDETCGTPVKDVSRSFAARRFMRRHNVAD